MVFWDRKNDIEIQEMKERIIDLDVKIQSLLLNKPDYLSAEEKSRLADLEVKMAKLWSLLIEVTPSGKDKLSKVGKRFGGQSKSMF